MKTYDVPKNILDHKLKMGDSIHFIDTPKGLLHYLATSPDPGHAKRLIGEVIFSEKDALGNELFSKPEYNDVVIEGSISVLEKLLGSRSTWNPETISEQLDINASVSPDNTNLKEEFIFGFMIGDGGSGASQGSVNAVNYASASVPGYFPFRQTTSQLTGDTAAKYCLYKLEDGKHKYYGKKFLEDPVIKVLYTDGSDVPTTITTTGTSKGIRVFSQMICKIDKEDGREYFTDKYGSITQARFNSLGLIMGFPHNGDFAHVTLTTLLNFRDKELNNNKNDPKMIYTIYCV